MVLTSDVEGDGDCGSSQPRQKTCCASTPVKGSKVGLITERPSGAYRPRYDPIEKCHAGCASETTSFAVAIHRFALEVSVNEWIVVVSNSKVRKYKLYKQVESKKDVEST